MPRSENQLAPLIRQEIAAAGPISLARFMQLALYHPVHGYYQQRSQQIGCQGDFYTSVSVGPLFGQLLAFHFAERLATLSSLRPDSDILLVEAGAHDASRARDILACLAVWRPAPFAQLQYWILEPSPVRREVQAT